MHRSQQDPLITDETAPQHVLVEATAEPSKPTDKEKTRKEQQKFGIFFDDDYDYLQHLRAPEDQEVHWEYVEPSNVKAGTDPVKPPPGLQLPSSVFASEFEEDEGLLRKAAPRSGPRPDWDPDIVAALDDDFDFENPDNELDDNFMDLANGGVDFDEADEDEYDDDDSDVDSNFSADGSDADDDGEEMDGVGPMRRFDDEETKSRFTEYSMTSSVNKRNAQLQLLDERFEKFFENYDEPEIGALDCEEIEGHLEVGDALMEQCLVEFKRSDELDEYKREWDTERIKKLENVEKESSDEELVEVVSEKRWDCESILSTYSNIYNHPKLIEEPRRQRIRINAKTGVPENVFHGEGTQLTSKALAKFDTENHR